MNNLLTALLRWNIYGAVLPYNLNWLRSFGFAASFLEKNPLTFVDVGARDCSSAELEPLRRFIDYVAFDADTDEAARLAAETKGFRSRRVFPYFVGESDRPQQFRLYEKPGHSSSLEPDPEFQAFFDPSLKIERVVSVESTSLDTFARKSGIQVDMLKLDTQGTEHDVLNGAGGVLRDALLIECEVEFTPIYHQQKLFHDICALLYARDFQLLFLNRVFTSRRLFKGPSRGQMTFGDALFGLNYSAASRLEPKRKIQYCLLLINYGLLDYAYQLFSEDKAAGCECPELGHFFRKQQRWPILRRFTAIIWWQFEKLLALGLYLRRTNRLPYDSDRSWPVR